MQFGLFGAAQAQRGGPDVDSAAGFKDYIEYVIEAEALGYQSAFIVEHHFTGFGQVSATLNLLTWIGARTRTLRLGTAVIVLPWHNPVLLAEQAATVDLLSGGRLDFGIGKGYRHNEFVGFRIPMEEAEPRFEESIDIITKAWTSNERFSFHGKYWQFDDIIVEPPTIQKPHPPFWQGAGHPESIRRVARRGHNLLLDQFASLDETGERFATYRDAMQANGFAFHPSQVGVARAFYVARDSAEKEAALDRRIAATAPAAHDLAAAGRQQHRQHHGVLRHARGERGKRAVRQPRRDRAQDREAARHGRGIHPAERRRHVARQPAPLRQGGDAGVPHRTGDARGGVMAMSSETIDADFVIVGAGSAGCVMAARLSEDPATRVVLLEAGGHDRHFWIHVPLGYGKTITDPRVNWCYETEPEPNLNGRRVFWPRGKVLGGSSSINGLVYIRGQTEDFDQWRQLGNTGWSFDDVLPYFRRAEHQTRGDERSARHRRTALRSPTWTTTTRSARRSSRARSISAIRATTTSTAHAQEGVGYYQLTTRNGRRCSTAVGYLRPAMKRRNLRVITNALTERIMLDGRRATGVTFRQDGAAPHGARRARGHPVRRRDQLAAAAAAVGDRSGAASDRSRHRGRARPARCRPEHAGPLPGAHRAASAASRSPSTTSC